MLTCALLAFLPYCSSPEAEGVSSRQVAEWIVASERELDALHGFVLLRHGKVIAEGSWAPYDTLNETHRLYSHSKSFTSTAVGFLVDDGKLDLDERVVDILSDKVPADPSDNLKALRVRDLLTMNVGAARTDAERDDSDGDWERAFLANTIDGRPGQAFRYDSGATYLLAAIVERRSGERMMDFLVRRLFRPLGIAKAWSTTSPSGTACGGWGMNMTTRELALFGQLYLNRGLWNGERILSEEWIALATSRQTWSGPIGVTGEDGSDWHQGYGFQFWRCRHGFYRADGANGQLTVVMPQYDAVLSVHAGLGDMQKELDLVWNHLLPALGTGSLPEDPVAAQDLKRTCGGLALPSVGGAREGDGVCLGAGYRLGTPVCGLQTVRIDASGEEWTATFGTESGEWAVPVGFGVWRRGALGLCAGRHEPLGRIVGEQRVASSAAYGPDGTFKVRVLMLDGPQKIDLSFSGAETNRVVSGVLHGLGGGAFEGTRGTAGALNRRVPR